MAAPKKTQQKNGKGLKWLLFILAFVLYANTIGHDYAWDDSIVITENPRVKSGFAGIPSLFLKYNSDYKADKYGYRPIVLSSFAIEYGLFEANPKVSHFMNVVYFALLCIVMFEVLCSLFSSCSNLAPFLITLIFLAHPVHTEVVANIKSRDELFALLFSLLALKSFIAYYRVGGYKHLARFAGLFLVAFLSKENAIMFLLVLPITLLYLDGFKNLRKWLAPAICIIILGGVSTGIYKLYTGSSLGVKASEGAGIYYESGLLGNSFFYTDVVSGKLANALTVSWLYLKNFFYPARQLYYYGYNQVPVANWSMPLVLTSLLVHGILLGFAVVYFKKFREISFGIFFYLITICVYLHLFRALADTMADRFLFTPSLGLSVMLVFGLCRLFKINLGSQSVEGLLGQGAPKNAHVPGVNITKYAFLGIFLVLSVKTFSRNRAWKDNYTLISTDMPYLENCARAHNYMADELKRKLQQKYDEATESAMIRHYKRSVAISGESYYAYLGLGIYYNDRKKYNESIPLFETMLQKFPNQADPNYYLGEAYYYTGNADKAVYYLENSLKLAPEVLLTYVTLSLAYSRQANYDKAISTINTAKEKFSESTIIYETLASIYFEKKDMEQSTKNALAMIRFGADPVLVYKIVIGRYQYMKQDSAAAYYYKQGIAMGLFNNQGR